ncbi:TonB-dependent receptor [Mucilaginibacter gracilis]|nr:TonB-dependent receptor [Mucilaginibacter gracilis]
MMRLTFMVIIFLLSLTCTLLAFSGNAQDMDKANISVNLKKARLGEVLDELEKLSGFSFTYPTRMANISPVSIQVKDQSLKEILQILAQANKLKFTRINQMISVSEVSAPATPGKISGKVLDEKGEPLPGATIKVTETGTAIQSNVDGTYQFSMPPGSYTIEVSYISYQAKRVTGVLVTEGKLTQLDIAMQPAKNSLNEVVVTSGYKKASVEGLYARQKNNAAFTDGISAEQIGRTPDKNIGESLKRISGVSTIDNKYVVVRGLGERYNGAMLNGQLMPSTELNRKQFSFDIIPSSLVDNVVVSKTITPDMSAEFGGGLVAVNTKAIPTENFLSVTVGESVNDHTTGKRFRSLKLEGQEYWGGLSDHRKLFGTFDWKNTGEILALGKFETRNNVNYLKNNSEFNNNWGLSEFNPAPSPNFQLAYGHLFPKAGEDGKIGIIASASYRNTLQTQDIQMSRDGFANDSTGTFTGKRYGFTTNIGALAGVGYTNSHTKISLQSMYLRTLDQQLILGQGAHGDNGYQAALYDITTQTTLFQHSLKGEYSPNKEGIRLNWNVSYTDLDRQKPDNHIVRVGITKDNPSLDQINTSGPVDGGFETDGGAGRWWNRTGEKNLGWNADLAVPLKLHLIPDLSNTFKTGYAGWYKDRFLYVFNTTTLSDVSDNPPLSRAFDNEHVTGITYSRFGDDFHRKAALHAGYVMLDQKIGKLRLVWGLRAEFYNLNKVNGVLDSLFVLINQGQGNKYQYDYSDLTNREKNMQFFPSANLTYGLTPKMNLRLAYSKSIIRPDLRELSFFKEYDFELGGTYEANDPIHSTTIHNYDFRYEWYPEPGDILSFSLFYKDLDYPMEIYNLGGNRQYTLRNNKSAKNKGIELELRKSFAFTGLPLIKHITLYSNFTALDASVVPMTVNFGALNKDNPLKITPIEVFGKTEHRPQAGASNYTYNGGFQYDDSGLSLNISYNYVSNRTYRLTDIYPQSLFERPINSLDGQLAFRILKKKAEVKFNVSNLLNASGIVYTNYYDGLQTPGGSFVDYPAPTTKQLLYDPKSDRLDYKASPGRTYSLAFTYNF